MKKNIFSPVLMAFGKVRETREFQRDFYVGGAAVNIIAVNPTREEQNAILGNDSNAEPIKYVDTTKVKDSKGEEKEVPRVRVTLVVKTDPKIACNNGIETTQFVSFFLSKGYLYSNKTGVTKIQVIDRFGRTAWVTSEELKEHKIPMSLHSKGKYAGQKRPANLDPQYRPAYIGEPELIENIRTFLNFPRPDVWDPAQETYVMKTNEAELADAESLIEDMEAVFKGDVSVIRDAFMGAPNNAYKLMFGVRTKNDGTLQQTVYTRVPMLLSKTNYKDWEKALLDDATANPPRHPDTFYKAGPLEKYSATPTDYSQVSAEESQGVSDAPIEDLPMDTSPFGESF